jgi:hypothetical protein
MTALTLGAFARDSVFMLLVMVPMLAGASMSDQVMYAGNSNWGASNFYRSASSTHRFAQVVERQR